MLCRWANCQFSGYGKEEGSPQEAPQRPEGALQNTAQLFWWRVGRGLRRQQDEALHNSRFREIFTCTVIKGMPGYQISE